MVYADLLSVNQIPAQSSRSYRYNIAKRSQATPRCTIASASHQKRTPKQSHTGNIQKSMD